MENGNSAKTETEFQNELAFSAIVKKTTSAEVHFTETETDFQNMSLLVMHHLQLTYISFEWLVIARVSNSFCPALGFPGARQKLIPASYSLPRLTFPAFHFRERAV